MLGLLIRVLVLCSAVFAVVYAVTRVLKANADSKAADRIREEVRALRNTVELGVISSDDYAEVAGRIRRDCERLGIPVPELPPRIKRPKDR